MAVPTTRQTFKEYCLRGLGVPVTQINVDDDQIEDRIDEALKYYYDYHYDGTEKMYLKHIVTADDITNKYITIPENIIGVVDIFDIGYTVSGSSMFDIRYQMALNDMYHLTNESLVPYYVMMSKIRLFQEIIVGKQPIRYNRNTNKLYIDANWDKITLGTYIVIVAHQVVDPETYTDAWGDRWLYRYTKALIQEQWGINLTKYSGIQLMGGITFNGDKILNDARSEKAELEASMLDAYSMPAGMMMG